ncbi:flagellar basal body P-ring formation chaperone FlgA [Alkalimonas amylolytica]|uniref:Flagella basal body P-ring formation protein FlgA n=1 Tax=Alkalimonas amylolytica TaxID=152573 RepID=A0A1H4BAD0_ALKAM|nr:flagellar basal body P-ring formation chaperone FlgA [Alkalimonas amylolytica]SEA45067.1 flagella basal body P-ring formation protein FlgA [Alkalimonas amylolytica]
MKMYDKICCIAKIILPIVVIFTTIAVKADAPLHQYSTEELTELALQWLNETQQQDEQAERQWQLQGLDPRIGVKSCAAPVELSLPGALRNRQATVQIRCEAPQPWQLFIPARFTDLVTAVVARQNLSPGTRLTADMLQLEQRERRLQRGTPVDNPEFILGARNRRAISLGQIISLQDLCLVCRGDVVTIHVDHASLSVSATGIAEQDGSLGDLIRIRNRQSNQLIEASVTAVNEVKVHF